MASHPDVAVTKGGRHLIVVGPGDTPDLSGEGDAQTVLRQAGADEALASKLGQEVAGLLLQLLLALPGLTAVADGDEGRRLVEIFQEDL
jgi:hypothetical protein